MNIVGKRIGGGCCLVVLLVVGLVVMSSPAPAGEPSGGTVPNFKTKDLDGKNVELSDLQERGPVLLSFWASWCKPCLRELPHIDALRKLYEEQGLTVVAVSVDQTRSLSKVKSYVKTHGYGFEVLLDPNQRVLRRLKGSSVPYTVLVSPQGENLYTHSGYRDGDELALKEIVDQVMKDFAATPEDAATAEAAGDAGSDDEPVDENGSD